MAYQVSRRVQGPQRPEGRELAQKWDEFLESEPELESRLSPLSQLLAKQMHLLGVVQIRVRDSVGNGPWPV